MSDDSESPFFNRRDSETDLSHHDLLKRLVEQLYAEGTTFAGEARDYFDSAGQWERQQLEPVDRILYSSESLKVTTRILHMMSWILVCKAVLKNEITLKEAFSKERQLRIPPKSISEKDPGWMRIPAGAQTIITRSHELFERTQRLETLMQKLDDEIKAPAQSGNPTHSLIDDLEKRLTSSGGS